MPQNKKPFSTNPAPLVIRILGRSGSGKTTLIETLIRRLAPLRVGVIKHTRHHLDLPPNEKDTVRFVAAGALVSGGLSPGESEVFVRVPMSLEELLELMKDRVDLVLVEGARDCDLPTVLVGEAPEGACLNRVICRVTRFPVVTPELVQTFKDLFS